MTVGPLPGVAHCGVLERIDEARRVVRLVLDVLGEDLEAIDLGGKARRERGAGRIAPFGHLARRARRVAAHMRLQAELADDLAALAERMNVAVDTLLIVPRSAVRHRHQLEVDRQEVLADDVQAGGRQEVVDVGHAAGDRVLDRDHGESGLRPPTTAAKASSNVGAGQRFPIRVHLLAGDVGIGARLALE